MPNGQMKSIDIQIAPDDLKALKKSHYMLCFAKKVNDTYNVVWQSAEDYLVDNTFSWQPLYELFGSNDFKGNDWVHTATNKVPIGLGYEAVLSEEGLLGDASSGGPATGITLVNHYGSIHPGLSAYSTGVDGQGKTTPIYVAETPIVPGSDVLTPMEVVQVWFEQDITTSTMFSSARSNAVEIDLTDDNTATRLYSNGGWSTPRSRVLYTDPTTILTIIAALTGAILLQDLVSKITSKLTGVYRDVKVDVSTMGGNTVKIEYREQPGLTGARLDQVRVLLLGKLAVDQLTEFTLESFAQLGVGYKTLNATTD
ncbi:hypothetical protein SAMN05216188_11537 [Lentzea xinjiangensis]|uniref:Uncharacterized protein n=1 Tax=Lentzea xinjiangensis TaxID=402600 RepID=A0A1H9RT48_9PSEU|nr:hypothetical protein [Lentzea xinjiangensis]SER75764.1 hypothetical protein SAMN05216188_11537 [Lentzea xinjiangensis]